MPKLIINLFGEKAIDWTGVLLKESDGKPLIPVHINQSILNFNPYMTPTLF